jgi:hypothetical protein
MPRFSKILIALSACVCWGQAHAFDRCDELSGPGKLREFIEQRGVDESAMGNWEQARRIQIETSAADDSLLPYSTFSPATVVYPSTFTAVLCRLTLAMYYVIGHDNEDPLIAAAQQAAKCIDARQSIERCLSSYGDDLQKAYGQAFAALDKREQDIAYSTFESGLGQLAKHEFGHHLLQHDKKLDSGSVSRIDAEFEADFYALKNEVQNGRLSGLYYFFQPMSIVENYTDKLNTPEYESAHCRASNAEAIIALFGIAPILLLDTVEGGGTRFRTPPKLSDIHGEIAAGGAPKLPDPACSRLATTVLAQAHDELLGLVGLIENNAELLKGKPGAVQEIAQMDQKFPRLAKLINDLESMEQSSVELKELDASLISSLLIRIHLSSGDSEKSTQFGQLLDRAIKISATDIMANDYSRLLQIQGVRILYSQEALEARIDKVEPLLKRATEINPALSESWMNLAFISAARGNCAAAADLAKKSASAVTDGSDRESAASVADGLRAVSDRRKCAEMGARALSPSP